MNHGWFSGDAGKSRKRSMHVKDLEREDQKKCSMVDIRPCRKIDACERSRAGRPMHVKDLEREDLACERSRT